LLIDMHVHTDRYSACGRMTPDEMAEAAKAAGLAGVVITEHNVMWSEEEIAELSARHPGLLILRGLEVSAANRHDILVYGVMDASLFHKDMPAREVVEIAHQHGGVAVWAHPMRYHRMMDEEVVNLPFDAIETQSVNIDELHYPALHELAVSRKLPEVYNSDGHDTISLGGYANYFHQAPQNEADLVKIIKSRAYTPLVRPFWAEPAMAYRNKRVADRIEQWVRAGQTDPEYLWKRIGGSIERINSMVAACLTKVEKAK